MISIADAVVTRELTRAFGNHIAVDRLNLRVPEGTIFGYLGLNGAGKSTTIKMLSTLLRPSSGSAFILGHDVTEDPIEVRKVVGFLGDDAAEAKPAWSGREYVRYFAGIHELANPREETDEILDLVKLDHVWRRRAIATYSTGMRRRVELARALLGKPRVLFLDEPTRGLDLPAKLEVWDSLRTLAEKEGVTMFISSHETAEILALCKELAVISKGKLTFRGPISTLARDPAEFEMKLTERLQRTHGLPTVFTPVVPQTRDGR